MKRKLTEAEIIEKIKENSFSVELINMENKFQHGIIPLNPTRHFSINERVVYGNHDDFYVRQIHRNGLYYTIESTFGKKILMWNDIEKYNKKRSNLRLYKSKDFKIEYLNYSIESLVHLVYNPGIDFDVEYQRDYCWSKSNKIELIDSIFNSRDIGSFVLARRSFSFKGKLYEIIDGKQRLSTICEYIEDRFKYKGLYYSELSFFDISKFKNHPVKSGILDNPTIKDKLNAFITLNTTGIVMSKKDINKAKKMLMNYDE